MHMTCKMVSWKVIWFVIPAQAGINNSLILMDSLLRALAAEPSKSISSQKFIQQHRLCSIGGAQVAKKRLLPLVILLNKQNNVWKICWSCFCKMADWLASALITPTGRFRLAPSPFPGSKIHGSIMPGHPGPRCTQRLAASKICSPQKGHGNKYGCSSKPLRGSYQRQALSWMSIIYFFLSTNNHSSLIISLLSPFIEAHVYHLTEVP